MIRKREWSNFYTRRHRARIAANCPERLLKLEDYMAPVRSSHRDAEPFLSAVTIVGAAAVSLK
jgi:hypothetical protein